MVTADVARCAPLVRPCCLWLSLSGLAVCGCSRVADYRPKDSQRLKKKKVLCPHDTTLAVTMARGRGESLDVSDVLSPTTSPLSLPSTRAAVTSAGAGADATARASAMKDLRERIKREREQLHDLEAHLSQRKPLLPLSAPERLRPDFSHALKDSPFAVSANASHSSVLSASDPVPPQAGSAGEHAPSQEHSLPFGRRDDLFPAQTKAADLTGVVSHESQHIASLRGMLIPLEEEHGRFQESLSALTASVAKVTAGIEIRERDMVTRVGTLHSLSNEIQKEMEGLALCQRRVEDEQRTHASKLHEQEKALASTGIEMSDLKRQIAALEAALDAVLQQRNGGGERVTSAESASLNTTQRPEADDRTDEPAATSKSISMYPKSDNVESTTSPRRSPRLRTGEAESGLSLLEQSPLKRLRGLGKSVDDKRARIQEMAGIAKAFWGPTLMAMLLTVPLALKAARENPLLWQTLVSKFYASVG